MARQGCALCTERVLFGAFSYLPLIAANCRCIGTSGLAHLVLFFFLQFSLFSLLFYFTGFRGLLFVFSFFIFFLCFFFPFPFLLFQKIHDLQKMFKSNVDNFENVHIFEKCSHFLILLRVSKHVPKFKKLFGVQKMFLIFFKNLVFEFCSEFQKNSQFQKCANF